MEFAYNNVLIYGYGNSGKAVEKVLLDISCKYKVYDHNIRVGGGIYELKLNKKTLKKYDLIVLSPGVSIYDKYVRMAKSLGIMVIGELEFGYMFTSSKIIGVTGTNGKTSTVGLITHILKNSGYKADSYGNIGTPLSLAYGKQLDYIVCEVSSFQLESINDFRCDICAILNIAQDHLDRHKNMKNYIATKLRIASNSESGDVVIINDDDSYLSKYKDVLNGRVMCTSSHHVVEGVYTKDNTVYYNNGIGISSVFGITNKINTSYLSDIMCAVCVAKVLNIDNDIILKSIKTWNILPHRLEFVTKSNDITYINDSKSTNVHSVEHALNSINGNIILMLGGKNKKLKFDSFVMSLPRNVKGVVTFGESAKYLYKVCKKHGVNCMCASDLVDGVHVAQTMAVSGDTILFSPGCTSFDAYTSYAQRGDHFKQIVLGGANNEK